MPGKTMAGLGKRSPVVMAGCALVVLAVVVACAGPSVDQTTTGITTTPVSTTPATSSTVTTEVVAVPPPTTSPQSPTVPSTSEAPAATTTVLPQPGALCEAVSGPLEVGALTEPAMEETSGIALSRRHANLIWAVTDSDNPPILWGVNFTGDVVATITLGVANVDWEDVAVGPHLQGDGVYIADTGDNRLDRDFVDLYRLPEPGPGDVSIGSDGVERLRLTYAGGPIDAEALFIDPIEGDLYLLGKVPAGASPLFVVPPSAWEADSYEAVPVGRVALGGFGLVTAADISPDGRVIAIRTYSRVLLWSRPDGTSVVEALAGEPCEAPAADEDQGESITLSDGAYYTVSEGDGAPLYRYDLGG